MLKGTLHNLRNTLCNLQVFPSIRTIGRAHLRIYGVFALDCVIQTLLLMTGQCFVNEAVSPKMLDMMRHMTEEPVLHKSKGFTNFSRLCHFRIQSCHLLLTPAYCIHGIRSATAVTWNLQWQPQLKNWNTKRCSCAAWQLHQLCHSNRQQPRICVKHGLFTISAAYVWCASADRFAAWQIRSCCFRLTSLDVTAETDKTGF